MRSLDDYLDHYRRRLELEGALARDTDAAAIAATIAACESLAAEVRRHGVDATIERWDAARRALALQACGAFVEDLRVAASLGRLAWPGAPVPPLDDVLAGALEMRARLSAAQPSPPRGSPA